VSLLTGEYLKIKGKIVKNLTNFIEFKGIHINEEGFIHLSYVGEEGVLFHTTMDVKINGDTTTFVAEDFEIVSKEIRKTYSTVQVLEYIETDLRGYGKSLSHLVLSIASIEERIGEKVICIDVLHGIQKFYDMRGNSIATSTDVFNEEEFKLYKMLERLFMR
jgi:hypothetical protein